MKTQPLIPKIPEFTEEHRKALEVLCDLATSKNPALNRLKRCPSTGVYHYSDHGNTDFITKKIAEEYYNRNRSNKKQAKEIAEELQHEKTQESKNENEVVTNLVVPIITAAPIPVNPYEGFQVTDVEKKMMMQDVLKNLLGNKTSREIPFSSITSTDFDFKTFDEINTFPNSDLTYAVYGEFILCWRREETFLLTTKKQMLWTFS